MIKFACPACQETYTVSDRDAGTKFACRACGQRVQVPSPDSNATQRTCDADPFQSEAIPFRDKQRRRLSGFQIALVSSCSAIALVGILLVVLSPVQKQDQNTTTKKNDLAEGKGTLAPVPTLAQEATAILKASCYRCHGENGSAEGGLNYLLDRDKLVERNKIRPGDPSQSRLYRRVEQGTMPPEDEKPRPSEADVAILKKWIEAGAPSADTVATQREFIANSNIIAAIHRDLLALPERERRFARYFTFTHLYNVGLSEDELQTYRHALAKLLNSLSWSREIVRAQPVDLAKTILRVDIRDLQWSDRVWNRILASNPYQLPLVSDQANQVHAIAGGQLPQVRADWFLGTASRPPLYNEILQLPDTERKLEEQLHIDVAENIQQEKVSRAGFNGSGVSKNNRLIERHASPYGAYWRSYDFGDNLGHRNLFVHPLGPNSDSNSFQADGGEIIFDLPNGLHAFMLVDKKGHRLDKAPSVIVSDPRRPDRAVENGLSCMTCHVRGLIAKSDQIRLHAESNPVAFTGQELQAILALYPPKRNLESWFERDNLRFRRAVEQTGSRFATTESIAALVQHYEGELDLATAAAEVGLSSAEFADRLTMSPVFARLLGSLRVPGGSIQREVFAKAFPQLVVELNPGN